MSSKTKNRRGVLPIFLDEEKIDGQSGLVSPVLVSFAPLTHKDRGNQFTERMLH
jgi:hypothetical protein